MPIEPTPATKDLSVVIPCYNEEQNLRPLAEAVSAALEPLSLNHEVILVDDGSRDNSWGVLKELAAANPRLCALRLAANSGQSAAMWAGIQAAQGRFIATLDADLQNDPRDLPKLLEGVKSFDCVCGTRVENRSQGDSFVRIISSRVANRVRNRLSGENITDAGCCFRVFKRECVAELKFFHGIHRFLPTLIKLEGHTVTEIPVRHNPRQSGQGHYGVWNRLFASFYDLLAVRWMKKRMFRYYVVEKVN